jgi:hypothetical protein
VYSELDGWNRKGAIWTAINVAMLNLSYKAGIHLEPKNISTKRNLKATHPISSVQTHYMVSNISQFNPMHFSLCR